MDIDKDNFTEREMKVALAFAQWMLDSGIGQNAAGWYENLGGTLVYHQKEYFFSKFKQHRFEVKKSLKI